MALQSKLFSNDRQLEAAAVSDSAHVMTGARGEHVRRIQQALIQLDSATIQVDGIYGPKTAAAVLAYKRRRNIVNRTYQTTADNVVGKMTVTAMDNELLAREIVPDVNTCTLDFAVPPDAGGRPTPSTVKLGLVGDVSGGPTDADVLPEALRFARQCLRDARGDLMSLSGALSASQPLAAAQEKTFNSAIKWLNLNRADTAACVTHINKATDLMLRNLLVKTSSGGEIAMTRQAGATFWGLTSLNSPDNGFKAGDPFFNTGGKNCRRDVVVHEFFHLVGVKHGGGALMGPTIRSAITTPAQALDSADNLAQLVAELRTFKTPNTDACTRAGD
jgi:peptidoglycan hydrolase-like protein with peptidoglycan-binding domain